MLNHTCLLIQWPTKLQRLYIKTALFTFSSIVGYVQKVLGSLKKIDVDYFVEISLLMSPVPVVCKRIFRLYVNFHCCRCVDSISIQFSTITVLKTRINAQKALPQGYYPPHKIYFTNYSRYSMMIHTELNFNFLYREVLAVL